MLSILRTDLELQASKAAIISSAHRFIVYKGEQGSGHSLGMDYDYSLCEMYEKTAENDK
jgi:hypothetical protein